MLIDDAVLPAAAHLTGPGARRVLRAAVEAADGELGAARACYVHYRPGHDVVVRYDASVSWSGAPAVEETLVAATTSDGAPAGTLPVEAPTADGTSLVVGVWRWPFDPDITGIADAVVPSTAAHFLDGLVTGRLQLEVVAFRPMQRAVVRTVDEQGRVHYLKAVRPAPGGSPCPGRSAAIPNAG